MIRLDTQQRSFMQARRLLVARLLKIRIFRYGLVGGIGIPINDLALLFFMSLTGGIYPPGLGLRLRDQHDYQLLAQPALYI